MLHLGAEKLCYHSAVTKYGCFVDVFSCSLRSIENTPPLSLI